MRSPPRLVGRRVCSDHWRMFLIARKYLDLSAFLIIAWCAYRIANSLQITVLIRTIVAEATIYLLAMVALQVYIQLSFALTV